MKILVASIVAMLGFALIPIAGASHAWGNYHWARSSNPFTVTLVDQLTTSDWTSRLGVVASDWSASTVLDALVGTSGTRQVSVQNASYGQTGWLGIATIYITAEDHIISGTVQLNDYYFAQPTYDTPAWRQLVICQEVGHTFGLDHQDTNFGNTNLGTCMDYTSDPDGGKKYGPDNEHPNAHDYEELELIYAHLDPRCKGRKCNASSTLARPDIVTQHEDGTQTVVWITPVPQDQEG
jgi:hypothetical protein